MKDVLDPLSKLGVQDEVDIDLLNKMIDTNTKKASADLAKQLAQF